MDKEEILKRSRQTNKDEREELVRDKSLKWTYLTMVIAASIFAFIRDSRGQGMMDLCATVCASVAVGQFYRFAKVKCKDCLIMGITASIIAVFAVVRFTMGH